MTPKSRKLHASEQIIFSTNFFRGYGLNNTHNLLPFKTLFACMNDPKIMQITRERTNYFQHYFISGLRTEPTYNLLPFKILRFIRSALFIR